MKKSRLLVIALLLLLSAAGTGGIFGVYPSGTTLVIDMGGEAPETYPWNPMMAFFQEKPITVLDKLSCMEFAASDRRIGGVVVKINTASYSMAKAQEFRSMIERFRERSGKPVYAYLELEGGGNLEYYVASAADKVYASPGALIGLTGLSYFRFYLGGLWEKLHVDVQVDKIAEYKSMGDLLGARGMSDAEREMANALLDSLYKNFVADIARSRGVSEDEVKEWIDAGHFLPEKYAEVGAIDGLAYLDEVVEMIGAFDERRVISERELLRVIGPTDKPRLGVNVAVLYGVGNIVTGEQPAGPFGRGNIVASEPMAAKLRKAMEDDKIDAVIYRIDSGGGSALASDLIWRATRGLKQKKPVVVSMSDVAASGGYYISCGANSIVAQPGTVTGSIGILTAHLSLRPLLEKAQVGAEMITRGEWADMGRFDRKLTEVEREKTRMRIGSLYRLFISRVGAGREMTPEQVNEIGRGRVWTGEQASEIGLVDELGGFYKAVSETKRLLGLFEDRDVNLVYGHQRVTLWKLLTGQIESSVEQSLLSPLEREVVSALRARQALAPGQPLAMMPEKIVIR